MQQVVLGLAGAVLFIVCLNISGMMLVRGANRERELAIRAPADLAIMVTAGQIDYGV